MWIQEITIFNRIGINESIFWLRYSTRFNLIWFLLNFLFFLQLLRFLLFFGFLTFLLHLTNILLQFSLCIWQTTLSSIQLISCLSLLINSHWKKSWLPSFTFCVFEHLEIFADLFISLSKLLAWCFKCCRAHQILKSLHFVAQPNCVRMECYINSVANILF